MHFLNSLRVIYTSQFFLHVLIYFFIPLNVFYIYPFLL